MPMRYELTLSNKTGKPIAILAVDPDRPGASMSIPLDWGNRHFREFMGRNDAESNPALKVDVSTIEAANPHLDPR